MGYERESIFWVCHFKVSIIVQLLSIACVRFLSWRANRYFLKGEYLKGISCALRETEMDKVWLPPSPKENDVNDQVKESPPCWSLCAVLQAFRRHAGNEVCSQRGPFLMLEPGLPLCNLEPSVLINQTQQIPFSIENLYSNDSINLIPPN